MFRTNAWLSVGVVCLKVPVMSLIMISKVFNQDLWSELTSQNVLRRSASLLCSPKWISLSLAYNLDFESEVLTTWCELWNFESVFLMDNLRINQTGLLVVHKTKTSDKKQFLTSYSYLVKPSFLARIFNIYPRKSNFSKIRLLHAREFAKSLL